MKKKNGETPGDDQEPGTEKEVNHGSISSSSAPVMRSPNQSGWAVLLTDLLGVGVGEK